MGSSWLLPAAALAAAWVLWSAVGAPPRLGGWLEAASGLLVGWTAPPSAPGPRAAATPVGRHGRLGVRGGAVVDSSGEPVRLQGVSLFWSQWSGQFWNKDVVNWLASDWNVAVVRAAMGVESGGYLQNPDTEKARVSVVVDAATAAGVYVIIDWHDHNADQHLEQSKVFFSEMAQRYGSRPNVIFEIWNEPTQQSWTGQIKPYHEQVVSVIREHSSNLIVLGTRTWSQDVDEASRDPVQGENLAYTLHFYAATHKGELRDKAQAALGAGAALFVTEWGTCEASGDGSLDLGEAATWLAFLAAHHISSANWAIEDKAEACAALRPGTGGSGGWPAGELTPSGAFVRAAIRGGSGPSPGPAPARRCAGRGGCSCDCGWASGATCQHDDGTCCWGCCCASILGRGGPFGGAAPGNATLAVLL